MTFGFAPSPATDPLSGPGRALDPSEWAAAGIPLLRDPRETVRGLHERHLPQPSSTVIAVLGPDERLAASASFSLDVPRPDGWECRNALLSQLRRIVPHDLRRRAPVRTSVLLRCRTGEPGWTREDGAWMWGLRDACTLHGLRCGAYVTLTPSGWQVLGEGRSGRRPTAEAPVPKPAEPLRHADTAPLAAPTELYVPDEPSEVSSASALSGEVSAPAAGAAVRPQPTAPGAASGGDGARAVPPQRQPVPG